MSIKGYHLDKQIMGYNYSSVVDSNDNYDNHIGKNGCTNHRDIAAEHGA